MATQLTSQQREDFLKKAYEAAKAAGHIYPEVAACEAAIESSWGTSALAAKYNNLFGQKQAKIKPLPYPTVSLPTKEEIKGVLVDTVAEWVIFPDWATCFKERMALLGRLDRYKPALAATSPIEFATLVSAAWSTDHTRGDSVVKTYQAHQGVFV